MICSMTAFACSEQQSDGWVISWELRSVNHRYLDATIRLPEAMRPLEVLVRERINAALSRGKVECNLKFQSVAGTQAEISLNLLLVKRLLVLAAELREMMGPGMELQLGDVLRWPGVVSEAEPDLERVKVPILTCLDQALVELVATRRREGERLAQVILSRCKAMRELVRQIRVRRPDVVVKLRNKLLSRLAELPLEPDVNRLEQEMVLFAQRLDVEEELDRIEAHLVEVNDVLQRQEPIGRRLDFLMQELNREANTLAAKSADTETTRATVDLKVFIEQTREQVQNIE